MKTNRTVVVGIIVLSLTAGAQAQTNSWIDSNGKWENSSNWSRLLAPSTSDLADLITNAGNRTVTIDATTSGGFPGSMTISNLTIGANSLQFINAGTATALHILNQFIMTNGAALLISNSAVQIDGGPQARVTGGRVTLLSGSLNVNSNELKLGSTGNAATLTVAGGSLGAGDLNIGETGTGVVWVTGGTLVSTSSTTYVGGGGGAGGVGSLILSNGTVRSSLVVGAVGTLSMQGGSLIANLYINPGGTFIFNQGLFQATSATRSGDGTFVIGDGIHSATMKLLGGPTQLYNFQSGLTVSSNAYLIGCGQFIGGNVVNYGTITNDCAGGTLSFSSGVVVTNSGSMIATNGAVIEFNGPVVNGGVINTLNGHVHFNSTLTNSGTLLNAGSIRVTPSSLNFSSVIVGTTAQASFTVTNVGGTAVTGTAHFVSGSNFGVVSGSPFSLAAHGATNVVVSFTPSFNGQSSDSAVFEANGDSFVEAVQGTGVSFPVAKFTATPTYGAAPLSVFFLDLSTGTITNEFWSFGDGNTTNIASPQSLSHTYQVPGTSTVTLIVSGPLGTSTNTQINLILAAPAFTPNSYTNFASGKWETGGNWSLGVPPNFAQGQIYVTNATTKTVTIDSTTSAGSPTTMNIGNLSVWSPQDSTNTLLLSNAGTNTPLRIRGNFYVGNYQKVGGMVVVTNSAIRLDGSAGSFEVGGTISIQSGGVIVGPAPDLGSDALSSPGAVWVVGGTLAVTNGTMTVAGATFNTDGQLTLSNGTIQAGNLIVGGRGFTATSRGTLTVAGGKMTLTGDLDVAPGRAGAGAVFITGGELTMTNGDIGLATRSFAPMLVSNATVRAKSMFIAGGLGSAGTLTIAEGATMILSEDLTLALGNFGGRAAVLIKGGQLVVTNGDITLSGGNNLGAEATITVSNGNLLARSISVASQAQPGIGGIGTLTVAGGTVTILRGTNGLVIGNGLGSKGVVEVTSGQLLAGDGQTLVTSGTNALGNLNISGGHMIVGSNLVAAAGANSTGDVLLTGGQLTATNGVIGIGNDGSSTNGVGVGRMTVSNGTLLASTILLGSSAGGRGDLFLAAGGTISCPGGTNGVIVINSKGWDQSGGNVTCGNTLQCGTVAPADYNITGGQACFEDVFIGFSDVGTMTMAGGVVTVNLRLIVGHVGPPSAVVSTGAVWITGGQLTVTNDYCIIGNSGVGQLTMSNGVVTVATVFVANSGNPGTLTVAGGTLTMLSGLTVGDCGGSMTGTVTVAGGNVLVTNAAHNATLDVRNGRLTLNGGLLTVDRLVMTNVCGRFIRGGGNLSVGSLVLDPNLDADGDGLPNGWEQSHGLNPLNAADANADNDGDGLSNLREYQLGSNPNDATSPYRITAIAREGNNIRITWTTVGGKVNVVQVSPGSANGSYANNFNDLSPELTILGSAVTSTNYLDLNGAINAPARYYRIRIVP